MNKYGFMYNSLTFFSVSLGCGGSSSDNNTYIVQTSTTSSPSGTSNSCTYTICPCSTDICRIRYDFTTMVLASQQTSTPVAAGVATDSKNLMIFSYYFSSFNWPFFFRLCYWRLRYGSVFHHFTRYHWFTYHLWIQYRSTHDPRHFWIWMSKCQCFCWSQYNNHTAMGYLRDTSMIIQLIILIDWNTILELFCHFLVHLRTRRCCRTSWLSAIPYGNYRTGQEVSIKYIYEYLCDKILEIKWFRINSAL